MFDWFGKRRREGAPEAPAEVAGEVAGEVSAAQPPAPGEPAPTLPVELRDAAMTMPASLEVLERIRLPAGPAPSTLSWLLGAAAPQPGAQPGPDESVLLRRLDAQLAAPALPAHLLPRAPAVVPQLLGLLRREQLPRFEIARQVAKDVALTAEVLREARSAYYGTQPVQGLEEALDRIGEIGLRQAMARVLVKPVFQAHAGGLAARAAPKLWLHAEMKSGVCAELMQEPDQRFEAFLAGLMHDSGWMALLRLLDRSRLAPARPWSTAFDAALQQRRDRLFGRLTADWALTPGLTRLAGHLAQAGAEGAADPLAQLLRQADRLCLAHLAAAQAEPVR